MNKLILWDLFGGGQNSIYNTVKEYNLPIDVYTFDITEPQHEKQFKLDLSSENVIEELKKYPNPDIIVASPLCQSFSITTTIKGGGTIGWKKLKDRSIQIRTLDEIKYCLTLNKYMKNWKSEVMLERAKLGKKCVENTLMIIEYFKPKFWYLENPALSLMWNYTKFNKDIDYFYNTTNYSSYGFLTFKPTTFLSNIQLDLRQEKRKVYKKIVEDNNTYLLFKDGTKIKWVNSKVKRLEILNEASMDKVQVNQKQKANDSSTHQIKEASAVSAIPHLLLKDILEQFLSENKKWYYINKELKYL